MKPIPETSLPDLLASATGLLLQEKRKDAESRIKQILIRQEAMTEQIRAKEADLKRLRDKMEKLSKKIERLRSGDWSVLAEVDGEEKGAPESTP